MSKYDANISVTVRNKPDFNIVILILEQVAISLNFNRPYFVLIGESAQQKKYKVVSLENPIAKVLLHERYSVALLRAVVAGMFKAFSYKGRSCLKVSILVSRYMLFEQFTSERCPMMYAPAGSVIDFVPRFHEFMTETLYVSNKLQYCFPRSLFNLLQVYSRIPKWSGCSLCFFENK